MSAFANENPADHIDARIEKLFRNERSGLMRFLARRMGPTDDAHDVLQEAFARLLSSRPPALAERPEAYLQQVVRNVLIDRFRRGQSTPPSDPLWEDNDAALGVEPRQEWAIEASDAMKRYRAVLEELPARTREIFELNRTDELTYQQIAGRYGVTVKAIEYHMSKALQRLHQAFYDE